MTVAHWSFYSFRNFSTLFQFLAHFFKFNTLFQVLAHFRNIKYTISLLSHFTYFFLTLTTFLLWFLKNNQFFNFDQTFIILLIIHQQLIPSNILFYRTYYTFYIKLLNFLTIQLYSTFSTFTALYHLLIKYCFILGLIQQQSFSYQLKRREGCGQMIFPFYKKSLAIFHENP